MGTIARNREDGMGGTSSTTAAANANVGQSRIATKPDGSLPKPRKSSSVFGARATKFVMRPAAPKIDGWPATVKVGFEPSRFKVTNMEETELFIDVNYYDVPSWGHLPDTFKINVRAADGMVITVKFDTTEGDQACSTIAAHCQDILNKQARREKREQPEHIVSMNGQDGTKLSLSPLKGSGKAPMF